MLKTLIRTIVSLVLASTAVVLAPTAAHAASTCSGTQIGVVTHRSSNTGDVVAHTRVHDSGTNKYCVRTTKYGVLHGTPTYMGLFIYGAGTSTLLGSDAGRFSEYAGPVNVTTTSCIDVDVNMSNRADQSIVTYSGRFCD